MISRTFEHNHNYVLIADGRAYYHELEGPLKAFKKFWNFEGHIKQIL